MSSLLSGELEFELEGAAMHEDEFEDELAAELEEELELGGVHELASEHVQEAEHEAYFNSLAAMADRAGRSQSLRRVAMAAARAALKGRSGREPPIEGEDELELESLPELELEYELEHLSMLPGQMEHLGHAAAEAATEQEAAEHFLPLIGLAAKFVLPKVAGFVAKKVGGKLLGKMAGKLITKAGGRLAGKLGGKLTRLVGRKLSGSMRQAMPQLTRGVANVARTLWRNPSTRPLLHAVPKIARTTVTQLARRYAAGRPITARTALQALARNTASTISRPRHLAHVYRRAVHLDRRYHLANRRAIGRPTPGIAPAAFQQAASAAAAAGMPVQMTPISISPGTAPGSVVVTPGCVCGGGTPVSAPPPPVAKTCPTCGQMTL